MKSPLTSILRLKLGLNALTMFKGWKIYFLLSFLNKDDIQTFYSFENYINILMYDDSYNYYFF